jgi:spermidine synthase
MAMPIDISEEQGVRYLHFGSSWIQGAMRIARPWSLELEYTREMMLALLLRPPLRWPARVLLVGLGTGSLLKFIYRHLPRAKLDVVEIDAGVIAAARQFFRLPEDARRVTITIADGDDFVQGTSHAYDLALVDGFDAAGRAGTLDGVAFYSHLRWRLSERGIAVANYLGRNRGFRAAAARLEEAFDGRVLLMPPCRSGNVVAFAAAGEAVHASAADLRTRAARVRRDSGLNLLPHLARLLRPHGGGVSL